MITRESFSNFTKQYLISREISPQKCLFFDIETTGFKPDYSHLYLIGTAALSDNSFGNEIDCSWKICQWMSEKPQEEVQLLRRFSAFAESFDIMIHFNGDRFDIPYLEEKYQQYGLPSPFRKLRSIDLYQEFKPLKSFLKLEHMKQKSLEDFLGLSREDRYDGGKLIPVYRDFCKTGACENAELLLLHNREDVSGMLTLTSLYGYLNVFTPVKASWASDLSAETSSVYPSFPSLRAKVIEHSDRTKELLLTFSLKTPVPVPVSGKYDFGYLTLRNDQGKLLLPLLEDSLYYFFEDYKNYYYLPQEDQAIHKSVASYVEKAYRQPARKDNCYIRQQGTFLPQPEAIVSPAFYRKYKDPLSWFLWKDEDWKDLQDLLHVSSSLPLRYLNSLLGSILSSS